jgi:hypothetical protein
VDEVYRLFPIPFMRARATLHEALVARLVEYFSAQAKNDNNSSTNLSHTTMLKPRPAAPA